MASMAVEDMLYITRRTMLTPTTSPWQCSVHQRTGQPKFCQYTQTTNSNLTTGQRDDQSSEDIYGPVTKEMAEAEADEYYWPVKGTDFTVKESP